MIKADTSKLEEQLKQYIAEVERKLKYMVAGFAKEITELASSNTPVGDAEALANRYSYRQYYEKRNDRFGIEVDIGFHAGAWVYSQDGTPVFDPTIYPDENTSEKAFQQAKDIYKLGQTFYIAATGPGYEDLNKGSSPKAPEGIIAPTMQAITGMYSIQLSDYYKRG